MVNKDNELEVVLFSTLSFAALMLTIILDIMFIVCIVKSDLDKILYICSSLFILMPTEIACILHFWSSNIDND